MALQRTQHNGAAAPTTLNGLMGSGDTTFNLTSGTNYPDGSIGPFYIVVDPGKASEEKILCATRSGTTVTVQSRGVDGTSATSHSSGAVVQHGFTAVEADDDNDHVYTTTRDDHSQYLLTTGARTVTGLTGATAGGRFAGFSSTTGPPTTGTFQVGDVVIATNGAIWRCATAGSPGAWNGTVNVLANVTTNGAGGFALTFPYTFAAAPNVVCTGMTAAFPNDGAVIITLLPANTTTTGFQGIVSIGPSANGTGSIKAYTSQALNIAYTATSLS